MRIRKIVIILIISAILLCGSYSNADNTEDWEKWQAENYWEWHTRITSDDKAYNGNHIVIENDIINFYGYWKNSYKDFLYKEYNKQGKKVFKFIIDESECNYHTLDGAGFIFNASKKENKLSGYILLFKEKDICIYKIKDVDINKFETSPDSTLDTYGKSIITKSKPQTKIHNLIIEVTPTNVKIVDNDKEVINLELKYEEHCGESFGLISSYTQHSCNKLSNVKFKELKIKLEDYKVSILNTDLQENPIPGGYFVIKDKNGNIVKEGKTDANAKMSIDVIQDEVYTVQQKTAPESYILNDKIYKFKVIENGKIIDIDTGKEIELIIKNDKVTDENNNVTDNEITQNVVENTVDNTVDNSIKNKDDTISNKVIPKAGENTSTLFIFIIFTIVAVIGSIIKIKKYNI